MLHPTEKYYPLRPEFAESTFYLYQATKGAPDNNDSAKVYTFTMLCVLDFPVIQMPSYVPLFVVSNSWSFSYPRNTVCSNRNLICATFYFFICSLIVETLFSYRSLVPRSR